MLAGDTDGLAGWPVTMGVVSQPAADAERYRCACAERGDGYQCGLDWGRSSSNLGRGSMSNKIILKNFRPDPPSSVDRPKIILFQHGTTSKIILKNFRLFQCFILTWNHVRIK